MDPESLAPDFRDVLTELADANAEFLLIGGWAMAYHGHVRGTDDLDILVRPTADNAKRVFHALAKFGAPVAAHGVTEGLFAKKRYGYRFGIKPHLIEILTTIDGVDFDTASENQQSIEIEGRTIPVIALEPLRRNKTAAGRPKDLADLDWLNRHLAR